MELEHSETLWKEFHSDGKHDCRTFFISQEKLLLAPVEIRGNGSGKVIKCCLKKDESSISVGLRRIIAPNEYGSEDKFSKIQCIIELMYKISSYKERKHILPYLGYTDNKKDDGYCLIADDTEDASYFVFPWVTNGDLLRYYPENKLSIEEKLSIIKSIVYCFMYLQKEEIYPSLTSKNLLISDDKKALLAHFGIETKPIGIDNSIHSTIYLPPEKIDVDLGVICDQEKISVYRLGVLFWELLVEKIPYSADNDRTTLLSIGRKIIGGEKLTFPDNVESPDWIKYLITDMMYISPSRRLNLDSVCYALKKGHYVKNNVADVLTFKEAQIHANIKFLNKTTLLWKTFYYLANNRDFCTNEEEHYLAKYWTAYYIYQGYTDEAKAIKAKGLSQAIELFKEAADNIDHIDSQYMYASLTYKPDATEAIQYFQKAADKGHTAAMYNLGLIYYLGKYGIPEDKAKGKELFKKAAKEDFEPAIRACNKYGIEL